MKTGRAAIETGCVAIALVLIFLCFFIVNNPDLFKKKGQETIIKSAVAAKPDTEKAPVRAKPTSKDNRWYIINNDSGKCAKSEGPSELIKVFRALGQSYEIVDDVVEDGKPMQVRILFKDPSGAFQLAYYRGKKCCINEALNYKRTSDKEVNRYK